MRILFVNEIEGATVSAVNGSLNYPADSIYHAFLRKKFKSTIDSDTLTIDLAAAVPMTCFFMGFHNVVAGTVAFFDGALSPVGTPISLTNAEDIFASYFASISVKRITVAIASSGDQVFVGGIGAGAYVQMPPDILAGFPLSIEDATTIVRSAGGQTSRNAAPSLRIREWTWPDIGFTAKNELDPYILALGTGKPVFVDAFEGSRETDPPLYGAVMVPRSMQNPSATRFDLTIQFKESR